MMQSQKILDSFFILLSIHGSYCFLSFLVGGWRYVEEARRERYGMADKYSYFYPAMGAILF